LIYDGTTTVISDDISDSQIIWRTNTTISPDGKLHISQGLPGMISFVETVTHKILYQGQLHIALALPRASLECIKIVWSPDGSKVACGQADVVRGHLIKSDDKTPGGYTES
jgi:hypothetical protein